VPCKELAAFLAITLSAVPAVRGGQASEGFRLPAPTGAYPVGRESFTWIDDSRSARPVKVDVWYPAELSSGAPSKYFPDLSTLLNDAGAAAATRQRYGSALSSIQDGRVRLDAHDNAQIRQTGRPFPLLLFSPGLGGSPFDYSIQLEELASRGYVVAAVEHIRDTFAVVLPDGHVVPFDGQLWERYASPSEPETIKFYEERAVKWAQDLLFVMENLAKLASMRDSLFFQAIDPGHVGAFGHSHGGRAAATACMLEARIRACLNEDGRLDETQLQRPYWPIPGRQFKGAFAMFDWFDPGLDQEDYIGMHTTAADYARNRLKSTGASLDAYLSPRGGSYHVTILRAGMRHTAFTDLPWLMATSPADRSRYAEYLYLIRSTVLNFFENTVRENAGHRFACDSLNGHALVQCYGPIQKR